MSWQRIVDVNLNRLDESLKFIEDCTRFILHDRPLLDTVRRIRRDFLLLKKSLPLAGLIGFRDSCRDPGRKPDFDRRSARSPQDLLIANFARAKESARTLEELLKTIKNEHGRKMKDLRFKIYDIEKSALMLITRSFNPRLCAIVDEVYLNRMTRRRLGSVLDILQCCGATLIQLRAGKMPDRSLYRTAAVFRKAITQPGVKYIVNNHLDIALASGADGVHLGRSDLPIPAARDIAGDRLILGASAHSAREAQHAARAGADYLGVGALFATKTKPDAKPCPLRILRTISRRVKIPVVGIGGINAANCRSVFRAGAAGIAVAAYLFEGDLRANLRTLTKMINSL